MTQLNDAILRLYLQSRNLFRDEKGQGMSEYALLVVLIAIFLIGGVVLLRTELANILTVITTGLRTR
ncbi:MAG: hypothetical protein DDT32_02275 [Syntrophomonadaceae bacterium]|nr:hypothetical protein [Bacillota bacterium]